MWSVSLYPALLSFFLYVFSEFVSLGEGAPWHTRGQLARLSSRKRTGTTGKTVGSGDQTLVVRPSVKYLCPLSLHDGLSLETGSCGTWHSMARLAGW